MKTYFFCVFIALFLGTIIRIYKRILQKRIGSITFNQVIESDIKFVLFLRSFQEDNKQRQLPISLFTLINPLPTIEEQIVKDFKEFELITIGKPGDQSLPLGAKRMYIEKEQWKSNVDVLIDKAIFIIIRPGFSEGVNWELKTIFTKKLMSKTIFYHLFSNIGDKKIQKKYYDEFRKVIKNEFDIELKEFSKNYVYSYFQNGLIHKNVSNKNKIPFVKKEN